MQRPSARLPSVLARRKTRPDIPLLRFFASSCPLALPSFLDEYGQLPGVLLANPFRPEKDKPDVTGWWLSEKLDGVRVYWNGRDTLYTRNNKALHVPDSFKNALPKGVILDGELFLGRNSFSETISIARSHSQKNWDRLSFMLFDIPSEADSPFEDRLKALRELFPDVSTFSLGSPHVPAGESVVSLLEHVPCAGRDDLLGKLKLVEAMGGEGLMLRQPKSKYAFKRSTGLLKYKSFYDAEARVVGYETGKGKYGGLTGSLKCEMASGKKFKIGSGMDDEQRAQPPAIGSIVTYRFQELTKTGVPRFPRLVGERIDKTEPEDAVVRSAKTDDEGDED